MLRTQRVYAKMMIVAISAAKPKYSATWNRPSIKSPTSFANPITCTFTAAGLPSTPASTFALTASMFFDRAR